MLMPAMTTFPARELVSSCFLPPVKKTPDDILAEVREHLDLPPLAYDVLRAYVTLNEEQRAKVKEVIAMLRSANMPPPES